MRQGVGFSVTINIIAIFIVVTFAFLVTSLNYYKAYKINNAISDSIEKYEGYNELAIKEIDSKLSSLGYIDNKAGCNNNNLSFNDSTYKNSYCIYEETTKNNKFKYKVVTYINFNIPIVNKVINLPVKTTTESIYYFSE